MFTSIEVHVPVAVYAVLALSALYLIRLNQLLKAVPDEVRKLSGSPWTEELLRETYQELKERPVDCTAQLPPKLERRYIVTGGSGLVGGYIVLQLLARGQPPESIRIIDIRETERSDMLTGPATEVDFVQTDISSELSVKAAFDKTWPASVASLPLTVFHTAAVIIPSERSKYFYAFPERINVQGTKNVLIAAQRAGADVFSSTSSASISIEPVEPFVWPWEESPRHFWQVLDERDFFKPLRKHECFFGNYPATKAAAERIVCGANSPGFRTGCIRPANGVYGNPIDNTVGDPLSRAIFPTFATHIVQSFVHGANVAIAHLQHEAVLTGRNPSQAGRPFVITDPNPPISYAALYQAIDTLSNHSFRVIEVPPALVLLLSYCVEWYSNLTYKHPWLRGVLPEVKGDIKYLKPGLFSICTHLVALGLDARKPVAEGGLGYKGIITTLQGMVEEIIAWNREHCHDSERLFAKKYTTSVSLAEKIQKLGMMGSTVSA